MFLVMAVRAMRHVFCHLVYPALAGEQRDAGFPANAMIAFKEFLAVQRLHDYLHFLR